MRSPSLPSAALWQAVVMREAQCVRCNNVRYMSDLLMFEGIPLCHGFGDRSPTCFQRTKLEHISQRPKHVQDRLDAARTGRSPE